MKKIKKEKNTLSVFLKMIMKIAVAIIIVLLIILVCVKSFQFGVLLFTEEGMASKGNGTEVVITVPSGATVSEVADILKKNGLIEDTLIFKVQFFMYDGEIYSGTYNLSTEDNPEDIVLKLKTVETEEDNS